MLFVHKLKITFHFLKSNQLHYVWKLNRHIENCKSIYISSGKANIVLTIYTLPSVTIHITDGGVEDGRTHMCLYYTIQRGYIRSTRLEQNYMEIIHG